MPKNNNAEQALQEWIKTQPLPVSSIEEHGFVNGYNWAIEEIRKAQNERE